MKFNNLFKYADNGSTFDNINSGSICATDDDLSVIRGTTLTCSLLFDTICNGNSFCCSSTFLNGFQPFDVLTFKHFSI